MDALHPRDDEDEEERFENVHTGISLHFVLLLYWDFFEWISYDI